MSKEKSRYFTFLLYPESIPADWEIKLESLGVPMAVSPLHDKDKSKVEGQEYKKAHYHVIYIAKNPVTADSVRNKVKKILGDKSLAKVQVCFNVENTYLYLTHESKDAIAKNKHVYDKVDIKHINNFDIDRYITLDVEDKEDILNDVCDVIAKNGLANILELRDYVVFHGDEVGLNMRLINKVIRSHTGLIRLYFDAVYQRKAYGVSVQLVDEETEESVFETADEK